MGKNTDRSFLFFFRGICWLVFAYSHVKEASTGIIRTMHTQKKRLGEWSKRGREGGKPRWNRNGAKVNVVGVTKMAERRGRCRLPTDLRDHSLPLSSHPFSLLFSLSILVSFPCNPSSRLVTLPVPPVSGFAVHWNARVIIPSFSIDLFRDTAEPTDFLFHCFCPDARAYLSLQLLPRMPFLPPTIEILSTSSWFLTVRVLRINLP